MAHCDISTRKHNKQEACAPSRTYANGSCLDLEEIIEMVKAYNQEYPNSQIELSIARASDKATYKETLIKQLNSKLSKCDDQLCWVQQNFIKNIKDAKMRKNIKENAFRPVGPQGKFTWLNTINIDEVLKQYEQKYKDFKFIGAVPIDFDDLNYGTKNINIKKLKENGISKLGVIYNLDEHWQSGSHWVSGYFDLNKGKLYYFDSYGIAPERRVVAFMRRIGRQLKEQGINPELKYNRNRHQYKNSECGVYSINFIIRLLNGYDFDSIHKSMTPDLKVNACRQEYFNIN